MEKRVSIITPCFKPDDRILETIRSVQAQTYQNYEHIIVDDATPGSLPQEMVDVIALDPRIKLIRRSWNAGPAVSRNRGIDAASGRFIAFLDADDLWHPDKLSTQIEFMLKHQVALSYTAYEVIDQKGRVLGTRFPSSSLTYEDVLKSNQIGCLTAIYDTHLISKRYMPNIAKRQDMGLWLSILKEGHIARRVGERSLARYRVGSTSVSSNKFNVLKYQWQIYREVEKLSLLKSINYFRHYAYRGLSRKI